MPGERPGFGWRRGIGREPDGARNALPERPDSRQEIRARSTLVTGRPADEVRPRPKEHEDALTTSGPCPQAPVGAETACGCRPECRRRRDQTPSPAGAHPSGRAPAVVVRRRGSQQRRGAQAWPLTRRTRHLHRPKRAGDAGKIRQVNDLLVSEELRPRTVGCLAEVVNRSLTRPVPSGSGLISCFPEKWKAPIGVAEDDHVAAPAPTREAASVRTRSTSGAAASQSAPSTCRGDRPSSWVRRRSNQRLMPKSL